MKSKRIQFGCMLLAGSLLVALGLVQAQEPPLLPPPVPAAPEPSVVTPAPPPPAPPAPKTTDQSAPAAQFGESPPVAAPADAPNSNPLTLPSGSPAPVAPADRDKNQPETLPLPSFDEKGHSPPLKPQSGSMHAVRPMQIPANHYVHAAPRSTKPPAFQPLNGPPVIERITSYQGHSAASNHGAQHRPASLPQSLQSEATNIVVEKNGPAKVRVGEPLTYEIVLRNLGAVPARNLMVLDDLPAAVELVEAAPSGIVSENRIQWAVDQISPGEERRFRMQLRPLERSELRTQTVAVWELARIETNTKVLGIPFRLETGGAKKVSLGETAPLKIQITNESDETLKGLLLRVLLPKGLEHPVGRHIEAELPDIAAGKSKVVDVEVAARKTGMHSIQVAVGARSGLKVNKEASLKVEESPVLMLKKMGDQVLLRGKVSEYRLELINQGGHEVRNVVVREELPPNIDLVAASNKGDFDPSTRTVQWTVGNLPPGHSRALGVKLIGRTPGDAVNRVIALGDGGVTVELTAQLLIVDEAGEQPSGPLAGLLKPLQRR